MTKANGLISMAESLPVDIKIKLIDKLLNSLHPSKKKLMSYGQKRLKKGLKRLKLEK